MRTLPVLKLYNIEANWKRRLVIVPTFPIFFVLNLLLVLWAAIRFTIYFSFANQRGLIRTTRWYWNTNTRYVYAQNNADSDQLKE